MNHLRWACLLCYCALVPGPLTFAADWAQFRGPLGQGKSDESQLPLTWDKSHNIRWRFPLPAPGNSSPIVSAGRVFITVSTDAGHKRSLICLDRQNGKQLWVKTVDFTGEETTHETNPACSGTPASDGRNVIAWYNSAGLHCYDFNGERKWSRDLGPFEHIWGHGASPIIVGDRVILNCGPGERTFVTALSLRDGTTIWQADEPGGASGLETPEGAERAPWIGSWSTPMLANVDGQTQIIVSMPHHVQAYDLATGQILWRCDGLGDLVYTSVVLAKEAAVAMGGYHGPAIGFRLGGKGNVTSANRLWRVEEKNPQRIGSGLILDKYLFIANEPGIAQCIDIETGEDRWRERMPNGHVWGSMVSAAGRLYVTNQDGDTLVMAPNPEKFELLAINSLDESSNSTPAISDQQIFLRTFEAVYCIAEP